MSYLYALRHKPTGRFLPRPPSGRKGGSWVEPSNETPRFFHRERDAKGFLTSWCQGPQINSYSTDWETGCEEYEGATPDIKLAKEPRIRDEWEVVTIDWKVV